MATKEQLEKKASYRIVKVFFIISALAVFGITIAIWWASIGTVVDTSDAYATCNQTPLVRLPLSEEEKTSLSYYSGAPISGQGRIRLNKECYRLYSGQDPELATQADVDSFKAVQFRLDEFRAKPVYTIQGTTESKDYNAEYLLLFLMIELGIFFGLRYAGLYMFGGKDALKG